MPALSSPPTYDISRLQNIIQLLFPPTVRVQDVKTLDGHIHPLHQLKLSNGLQLILKFSSRPSTSLLRRERRALETEARVLALLGQSENPCIPQLFHFDPLGGSLGSGFLLRQYARGSTVLEMESLLTPENRQAIDRHLGNLAKIIGKHVALSFGPLEKVANGAGSRSWHQAFIAIFEEALRDSEDMFIHLPYSEIRQQITRLSPALEEITTPQLVIVNLGRPSEVLIDPELKQLSGVIDLGSAFWGDVLLAEIFDNPSSAVLEGYGMSLSHKRLESIRLLLCVPSHCMFSMTSLSNHPSDMRATTAYTGSLSCIIETNMTQAKYKHGED
jgi:hypothetical protein